MAVFGDSITEQKQYSVFIEDYLLMCQPAADLRCHAVRLGRRDRPGFLPPHGATTCCPFQPDRRHDLLRHERRRLSALRRRPAAKRYRDTHKAHRRGSSKAGVRLIVVGSPGCVDTDTFRRGSREPADVYNETLAQARATSPRRSRRGESVVFANVFDPMMDVDDQGQGEVRRASTTLAGGDGVHPAANGQLVMAYAFLKALGCDGNIGTITVDLAAGKAEATDGHKVLSCADGAVEVESTRYPFCFFGDPARPRRHERASSSSSPSTRTSTASRWSSRAPKAATRYKVTWGKAARSSPAPHLGQGHQPRRRVPRQPLLRALPESRAGHPASSSSSRPR